MKLKPGSILKWKGSQHHLYRINTAIVIRQSQGDCLLYDVEDGKIFLGHYNWILLRFEEAT